MERETSLGNLNLQAMFSRMLANQGRKLDGADACLEMAAVPDMLGEVFRGARPKRRRQLAEGLAAFLCREVNESTRHCNDLQIEAAFAFLARLIRYDTEPNGFFEALTNRTMLTFIERYITRDQATLSRLSDAALSIHSSTDEAEQRSFDEDRIQHRLHGKLQQRLAQGISDGGALGEVDEVVRHLSWTGAFSADLAKAAPVKAEDHPYPGLASYPPISAVTNDEEVAHAIQQEAALVLHNIRRGNCCAAKKASLHMLAVPSEGRTILPMDEVLEFHRKARASRTRVVVDRGGFQSRLWGQIETRSKRMDAADQVFMHAFKSTPQEAMREVSRHLTIDFMLCGEGPDASIELDHPNRFQQEIVHRLSFGRLHDTENLLRGTGWCGCFTENLRRETQGGAAYRDAAFIERTRNTLLRFAIPAMYRAMRARRYDVAAALGQMLLDNADRAQNALRDSIMGQVANSLVRDLGSDLGGRDNAISDRTRGEQAQAYFIQMRTAALDAHDLAIDDKQPPWLQQV